MSFKRSFSVCLSILFASTSVSLYAMEPAHRKNNSVVHNYFEAAKLMNEEKHSKRSFEIMNNAFFQDNELEDVEEGKCSICIDNMDIKEGNVIKLNCDHMFHVGCMIYNRRFRLTHCPICREFIEYASKCNGNQFANGGNDDSKSSETILENGEEYVPYCEGLMKCIIF